MPWIFEVFQGLECLKHRRHWKVSIVISHCRTLKACSFCSFILYLVHVDPDLSHCGIGVNQVCFCVDSWTGFRSGSLLNYYGKFSFGDVKSSLVLLRIGKGLQLLAAKGVIISEQTHMPCTFWKSLARKIWRQCVSLLLVIHEMLEIHWTYWTQVLPSLLGKGTQLAPPAGERDSLPFFQRISTVLI